VSDDCIFCRIVSGDLPSHRIHEDERTIAFLDVNPGTRGHLLVIPRQHAADLADIGDDDVAAVARTVKQMAARVRGKLDAQGVTIVQSNGASAWQTVFHYHVHVLPRYKGDSMRIPWHPGDGAPELLTETADALRD
jgi:histidine triad (HIT) family protein